VAGERAGRRFAAGVVVALSSFVLVILLFGHALKLPQAPTLSSSIDLVIAAVLLLAAAAVHFSAHHARTTEADSSTPKKGRLRLPDSKAAFPFGLFSMGTNFTTLALAAAAAKEISALDVEVADKVVLAVVLVALASATVWVPVAMTMAMPTAATRLIGDLRGLIDRHGRTLTVVALVAAGLFFAVRAVVRLAA
jgi:hypothetical protein